METALERLNSLPPEEARAELLKCCGSARWAEAVAAARPFRSVGELLETADRVWWELSAEDWLEAFRAHPRIGERKAAAEVGEEARRWSEREQSGARGAPAGTLEALAEANRAYEGRFGFIFIVCAAGKSAGEMLSLLGARMDNEREAELRVAAGEQSKITRLRLQRLLET
ncbi:MAG TPA: 2-oxo-4-hydroxy-4-carboxy-5-ureidoimidazoline decarboxylase [Pyrinomonadaceae bacterium]|nr:2-oxo-4-hydroxy-4-carboxy-5-ureidoimidazoline decarboxylase [Pyrinomonadaceae bacterium]